MDIGEIAQRGLRRGLANPDGIRWWQTTSRSAGWSPWRFSRPGALLGTRRRVVALRKGLIVDAVRVRRRSHTGPVAARLGRPRGPSVRQARRPAPAQVRAGHVPLSSGTCHMGHAEAYVRSGTSSPRYWVQKNFNIMHPIGWDAFGLPAETPPSAPGRSRTWTYDNIAPSGSRCATYACSRSTGTGTLNTCTIRSTTTGTSGCFKMFERAWLIA